LLAFLYFNVSLLRLQNKPLNVEKETINPNLLKLFLRHFKDFAKKVQIDTQSDDEDYVIPVYRPDNADEITLSNLTPNVRPPAVQPRPPPKKKPAVAEYDTKLVNKKVDIFAADENHGGVKLCDLKNKIDFPSLGETPIPKPVEVPKQTGWSAKTDPDFYLYTSGKLSKKEKEEEFPTLGGPPKSAAAEKVSGSSSLKTTPTLTATNSSQHKQTPAPAAQPDPTNWIEQAKQEAMQKAFANSGVTIIKGKKKKK